jgi:hypothetical protein
MGAHIPFHKVSNTIIGRDEKWQEVREKHDKALRNYYSSPIIMSMVKPGRMKWVGHVA